MATIYPDADGAILQALLSDVEEVRYADPPANAGPPLRFDHDTNPDLVVRLHQSTDGWRIEGMTLLDPDGTAVTINPPAPTPPPAVDPAAIGAALAALPDDAPLTKADLAPLLALFGAV